MIGDQIKTEWIDLLYEVVLIGIKEQYFFKIARHKYRRALRDLCKKSHFSKVSKEEALFLVYFRENPW